MFVLLVFAEYISQGLIGIEMLQERAHKIKGLSLLASGEPASAQNHFEIALGTFEKLEQTDQVNEIKALLADLIEKGKP